jgi:transposase-like protein
VEQIEQAEVALDEEGKKQVLGVAEGASENQVVAKRLLEDMVRRGVRTDRKDLFVIDGSKALRAAIDAVFGTESTESCHKECGIQGQGFHPCGRENRPD